MPTGAFVARRNGKVFVTGNSGFPKSHDVSRAIDREAGAVREVVGRKDPHYDSAKQADVARGPNGQSLGAAAGDTFTTITAPATEAARQWEGHGTALKPAWEPIIVARKPLEGTVAANVQRWGCGALAIDASRVEGVKPDTTRGAGGKNGRFGPPGAQGRILDDGLGRWPANVVLDEEAGAALDAQSGNRPGMSGGGKHRPGSPGGMFGAIDCEHTARGDSGGASRFFKSCDYTEEDARFMYCAKASRAERDAGLEGFEPQATSRYGEQGQGPTAQQTPRRPVEQRNIHPTVKPLALAAYLARLILPPVEGTRLLVPFCGSGSEMIGGLRAGWSHVEGIDSWDVAVKIARARLAHHEALLAKTEEAEQLSLVGT